MPHRKKCKILKFKREPYIEMLVREMAGSDYLVLVGITKSGGTEEVERLHKDDVKIGMWFKYRAGARSE